jgi:hypothetical protein
MFQSLEHCRRPAIAVANASSLLSDNGLFVIDVPNMGCVGFDKYGPAWWHADVGRHLQFFTQASLTALLASASLCPVKWEYQGFVSQFTNSWISDMADVLGEYTIDRNSQAKPAELSFIFTQSTACATAGEIRDYSGIRAQSLILNDKPPPRLRQATFSSHIVGKTPDFQLR